jgi:hypothetical protein
MVVEVAFIFSFTIQFCHVLEAIKHAQNNFLVRLINTSPYLQIVGTN